MKNIIFILCLFFISNDTFGQWQTLIFPSTGRCDDLYFLNDSIGWVAGGNTTGIHKTKDGGKTWSLKFVSNKYLRSIEFATPTLGFAGSLDSSLFKTVDGGETWVDISNTINPKPPGICGLSAPSSSTIYGCGIWNSPAFVIKTVDGGNTWNTIDMSNYASSLIDIHFINVDTGFVIGTSNNISEGGIILYTKNGGVTWEVKYKTMIAQDRIWKIQSPDGKHYYASIQALPTTNNVRLIRSNDSGNNWNMDTINNNYSYIQVVGFIDSLQGWIGGNSTLFETKNGGLNWNTIVVGSAYNRFFKVNDSLAFMSGSKIYKYDRKNLASFVNDNVYDDLHKIDIYPNPVNDILTIELFIHNKTFCDLSIYNSEGRIIENVYRGHLEQGINKFKVQTNTISSQIFYLTLNTNEGMIFKKVQKL